MPADDADSGAMRHDHRCALKKLRNLDIYDGRWKRNNTGAPNIDDDG